MKLSNLLPSGSESLHIINDGIWRKNAVFIEAVGLFPLIAYGVTLKNGVVLSIVTACVLIPMSVVASLIGDRLAGYLREPVYAVFSAAFLIPAVMLAGQLFHGNISALGMSLSLLFINTLLYFRKGIISVKQSPISAAISAFAHSLGFALVLCVVSGVREIASLGTIWGVALPFERRVPAAALPFAGFIVLGFIIALYKAVLILMYKDSQVEVITK